MSFHRHIFVASLGGVIEFFDFTLMIFLTPVLAKVFFPISGSSSVALLAVISSFSVGYLCRSLGGVIFSHVGDRLGRKKAFLLTIVLMSASTLVMGILPGYHQWGILAPVSLVILRMIQGISFGGDVGTVVLYVIEIADKVSTSQ